ncbi:MAG: hypothetical protein ACRC6H_02270 [Culicoidibacterales bacterium]
MGRNEQLKELDEERNGVVSLRNTVAFSKWTLAFIATMALATMFLNFIRSNTFFSSYAGIGIVFFSFAALLDILLGRIRIWLIEIDQEMYSLKQEHQDDDGHFDLK